MSTFAGKTAWLVRLGMIGIHAPTRPIARQCYSGLVPHESAAYASNSFAAPYPKDYGATSSA